MALKRVLLLCFLLAVRAARATVPCEPVSGDEFCSCRGSGFTIDLRHILSLPVEDIPDKSGAGEAKYSYSFNPCTPFDCQRKRVDNGLVCQSVTREGQPVEYVNIARDTVAANWTIYSVSPLIFEVLYGGGDRTTDTPTLSRQAKVIFSYSSADTSVEMNREEFDGQGKILTYDFSVSGRSIIPGPPVPVACEPVSGDEFCSCRGSGFTIDLRHILTLPVDDIPDKSGAGEAKYSYSFNPCTPFDCQRKGFYNGLVCQSVTREGQPVEYVNIARDTVAANWTIYSVSPLKFEVLYGGGDRTTDTPVLTRQAKVVFEYTPVGTDVVMNREEFDGEAKTLTYDFLVTGSSVTPVPKPVPCELVSGDEFCSCKGSNFLINLRHILSLPLENIPDTSEQSFKNYTYTFSACSPFDCQEKGENNALICQTIRREGQGVEYVNVARNTVPSEWTVFSVSPLRFSVLYGGGDKTAVDFTRQAMVTFEYNTAETSAEMNKEELNTELQTLTYGFQITGKNVTISSVPCEPVIGDEFCSCKGSNFTIDLRHIMPLPFQNIPDARQEYQEKYHYTVSPCTSFDCQRTGVDNGLICQSIRREGQATEYVNIATDTVPANWTIYSVSPLKFEVLYGGGDSTGERTRQAKLAFIHSSNECTLNAFVATEATAGTDLTYMFEINGTIVTTSDSPESSTDNFQVGVVNNINGEETEKDTKSSSFILPIILAVMIVLGGVVCFVIGVLTGYCKWGKLRKYSAKRKQGWNLFNADPTTHQTMKTDMNG